MINLLPEDVEEMDCIDQIVPHLDSLKIQKKIPYFENPASYTYGYYFL